MIEVKETFEGGVSRLVNYLTRAYKYDKPSILFAMYLSEFLRSDVEKSLKSALAEQGLKVMRVDAGINKDLPAFFSSINSDNTVFSVHNMEKGFPDALQYLNFKREELIEHHIKAVFWVREEELARISLDAPDFFAFRNRVVEFMEVPTAEERRPALVEFALETEYRSLEEIKRSIELKEKLLSELSAEDEISGYLLLSLGILYYQIGSYKKSLEYYEKALKIAQDIGNRQNEGAVLGNLGLAYHSLGEAKRAIEYYEQALTIARKIGDRRNEGAWLGNLGVAYYALGQLKRVIGYYEQAITIAREIKDKGGEGYWLNNLGVVFKDLKKYDLALACYLLARKIRREIRDPEIETTENNIIELKNKIGKEEFQKLLDMVELKAEEIVQGVLGS
jgi:tetratricopeptide (TPR) repeat protein